MLTGSVVALATPMDRLGNLDLQALEALVEMHCEAGTSAIVTVGTTGESATLTVTEHLEVVRRVCMYSNGRLPVIAGTGANSTQEAISLTREAARLGVAACLLVTPYYNKPTQEGLYLHYQAIARAVKVPQLLYNVPGRTACDLLPQTVARLAKLPNIVGIKEAGGMLERFAALVEISGVDVYCGDDAMALEALRLGARANISVTANVVPRQMSELCQAALEGRYVEAEAIDERLRALHRGLFVESNPIPVKWVLAELGWIQEGIRLPLTALEARHHQVLREALRTAGVQCREDGKVKV